MAFIVQLFREKNYKGYYDMDFNFTIWEWRKIIKSSIKNGWIQEGTKKPNEEDYHFFKPDYEPDYPFEKIVTKNDAFNWRDALISLLRTKPKGKNDDVIIDIVQPALLANNAERIYINEANTGIKIYEIKNLIDYYNKGEFYFWADD